MEGGKNYILGIFEDEDVLLDGIKNVQQNGVKIHEVFSPYPVHGLEHADGMALNSIPANCRFRRVI